LLRRGFCGWRRPEYRYFYVKHGRLNIKKWTMWASGFCGQRDSRTSTS
jgi:hypothetical protein